MIILDTTSKTLEVVLAGAVTTNELPFDSSYADLAQVNFAMTGLGANDGVSNGATAVTVVAAPAAGTSRQVKYLSVMNKDTVAATVTVQLNNAASLRQLVTRTLEPGETLQYLDGWSVLSAPFVGQELGQVRENSTSAVSVYAASSLTKITSIVLCNQSGASSSFSLYLDSDGTTYDETTQLYDDAPIAANTTVQIDVEWWLAAGGNLAYAAGNANAITITAFGEVRQ